jgi:hypothetical protein
MFIDNNLFSVDGKYLYAIPSFALDVKRIAEEYGMLRAYDLFQGMGLEESLIHTIILTIVERGDVAPLCLPEPERVEYSEWYASLPYAVAYMGKEDELFITASCCGEELYTEDFALWRDIRAGGRRYICRKCMREHLW